MPLALIPIPPATRLSLCRTCRAPIYWVILPSSARAPVSTDCEGGLAPTATAPGRGINHFANCPHAARYRRPRPPSTSPQPPIFSSPRPSCKSCPNPSPLSPHETSLHTPKPGNFLPHKCSHFWYHVPITHKEPPMPTPSLNHKFHLIYQDGAYHLLVRVTHQIGPFKTAQAAIQDLLHRVDDLVDEDDAAEIRALLNTHPAYRVHLS